MGHPSVNRSWYNTVEFALDTASFIAASVLGSDKLRELEWINGPVTQESIALTATVNSLALYLSRKIAQSDDDSSLYRTVITLAGFAVGYVAAPYVVPKFLKDQAVLLTSEMVLCITCVNLAAKTAVFGAFKLAEMFYDHLTFPPFENFEKMTPKELGILLAHFKSSPEEWKEKPCKQ